MPEAKFTRKFASFACVGDSITYQEDDFDIVATIHHDSDRGLDDDDCFNPDQKITGCNPKQQKKLLADRKAFKNGKWSYCGIVLSVEVDGQTVDDYVGSLWGIELNFRDENGKTNDGEYLTQVANELLSECIDEVRSKYSSVVS